MLKKFPNVFNDLKKRNSMLLSLFENQNSVEFLNIGTQAASPSKDYCQLIFTNDRIILRKWRITLRNDSENRYPSEYKDTYEEFINDENLQRDIVRFFGLETNDFILNVVECGKLDILCRLPEKIVIKIISFLNLENIAKLSQVNRFFRHICRSDNVWMELYKKYYTREITKDLSKLAERDGWRKLFFTNKIKLQLELRRQAKNDSNDHEFSETTFHTPRRLNNDEIRSKRATKSTSRKKIDNMNRSLAIDSRLRFSTFLTED